MANLSPFMKNAIMAAIKESGITLVTGILCDLTPQMLVELKKLVDEEVQRKGLAQKG